MSNEQKPPSKSTNEKDFLLESPGVPDEHIQEVHHALLREKEEPRQGFAPIPIFLLFLISALMFFGGIYMAWYSGGFDPMVYDETIRIARYAPPEDLEPEVVDPVVAGRRQYTANCQACHQANGMGVPGAFPPLVDSPYVTNENKLIRVVLNGFNSPEYPSAMMSFASLSNERIAHILTFIRQEWGNDYPEVTTESVASVRAQVEGRGRTWTPEELEAYAE